MAHPTSHPSAVGSVVTLSVESFSNASKLNARNPPISVLTIISAKTVTTMTSIQKVTLSNVTNIAFWMKQLLSTSAGSFVNAQPFQESIKTASLLLCTRLTHSSNTVLQPMATLNAGYFCFLGSLQKKSTACFKPQWRVARASERGRYKLCNVRSELCVKPYMHQMAD